MSFPSSPPPLPAADSKPASSPLAIVLSLVLLLFLVSAALSLLDNSLLLFFHRQEPSLVAGVLTLLMLPVGFLTYCLMGFSPAIPKRLFLPVSLFLPVAYVAALPLFVYFHEQALLIVWAISIGQMLLALLIVHRAQGGWKIRWPLFPARGLRDRTFRWGNLAVVALGGLLVLLPGVMLYAVFSAQLAVAHFTDGFVTLRPSGIVMQVRKYARDDGRTITLVPMAHIGEPKFYRDLAASFPEDSLVLMEGVTDHDKLMPGRLDYSRMAAATGAVPQVTTFKPRGTIIPADVDMSSFSPGTLDLLKSVILFHAKGLTPETLPMFMKPAPPDLEKQLMDDLLTKRNHHLLGVIQECLQKSNPIIVPWGAAHMPEISREIQALGFHMMESHEHVVIHFGL